MRIIAYSDTHGRYDRVETLIERTKSNCDLYLFAGDNLRDINNIEILYPGIRLISVPGNCDYNSYAKPIQFAEEAGKKIILTHGHYQDVKYGMDSLERLAKDNGADIVVYGHTHRRAEEYRDGVYYVNPGSLSLPKDGLPPSYAIIDILSNGVLISTVDF